MLDSILVWFRRDLRDADHAALAEATRRARRVFCVFVFDNGILDRLPSRTDRRLAFIRESLIELDRALRGQGGGLIVRIGRAEEEIPRLAMSLGVNAVFTNRDYEPQAKERDRNVERFLAGSGIGFEAFKDQVIFEHPEVLTAAGRPFTVFTAFKNQWLKRLTDDDWMPFKSEPGRLANVASSDIPTLDRIGFNACDLNHRGLDAGTSGAERLLNDFLGRMGCYREKRDFPAADGTSFLSVHVRFGTISIRSLVASALKRGAMAGDNGAATWLSELIWRDFFFMILDCFPHVAERSFKPDFDRIIWENGTDANRLFESWCEGHTGYPLVDAAMRQLNGTGYMHNRLRMVTASFLVKDLGIDWRRGEAYFAERLNDFDLAANNGGWQWSASCGCDAQPYFRIFNPVTQSERFDAKGEFIRTYLPELGNVPERYIHAPWRMPASERVACGVNAYAPLVEHEQARRDTLARYGAIRSADDVSR